MPTYNIDAPKGAIPVRGGVGAGWNGEVNTYLCPSSDGTALYVGDFVTLASSAGATGTIVGGYNCEGMPTIKKAAGDGSEAILGVVVGFTPKTPSNATGAANLELLYREASTDRVAYVVDDPNVILEIQEDADTTPLVPSMVGMNIAFSTTAGSTLTGISGEELDSTTQASGSTLPLKLLRLAPRADNCFHATAVTRQGSGGNPKWLVKINNHVFKGGTGTSGV